MYPHKLLQLGKEADPSNPEAQQAWASLSGDREPRDHTFNTYAYSSAGGGG